MGITCRKRLKEMKLRAYQNDALRHLAGRGNAEAQMGRQWVRFNPKRAPCGTQIALIASNL
jgi:hypothetical protein